MIDIHSHILPAVDDGARTMSESLDMIDAAASIGFRLMVATPHLMVPLTSKYQENVHETFEAVRNRAQSTNIELVSGFEVRLTPDLGQRLQEGEAITLNGTKVVLIDLPTIQWPLFVESALFNVQMAGFLPVLAHPERYPEIQKDPTIAARMADRGIGLQVTIGSFSHAFGKPALQTAESLLTLGAVHLAASDAHSPGHRLAAVPPGLRRLNELLGPEGVQQLLASGPSMLLNQGVLPDAIRPVTRSWFSRITEGSRRDFKRR